MRKWLVAIIPKYDVKRLVDAPCGDFNWMKLMLPQVDIEYFGFDIVDEIISSNDRNYGADKIQFAVADICKDDLPISDLLIVRDCLFHLSYEDIEQF